MDEPVRAALLAVAWLAGWWLCGRVRVLPRATDGSRDALSPVSVIIPARDEARALPTLLAGLAAQDHRPHEIIVVDDDSTDATATVAAAHGAHVVSAGPLPDGWTGKAWALWQGASRAQADLLVMLDADVDPGPELLHTLLRAQRASGGMVSVQPYHRMQRWWERASAFFNLVAVMGIGLGGLRRPQVVAAFGPVVACPTSLFRAHGGAPAVRGAVLEDVELARAVHAAGEPVTTWAGGSLVTFRMYDSPRRLLEGWSKNFASGAGAVPLPRLVLVVAWVTACLVAGAWVLGGTALAVVCFFAFAVQCFVQLRQLGSFGIVSAVLFPLLALLFVVLFAWSLVVTARGSVTWKGRRITLRPRSTRAG
jgi:4,4'-diaponeurosporenoate glycosyltransferase